MRNTQQGSQKVDNPPSTRVEVVIRKFRITAADVLPAHTGVIFGWEYYPFPPNFSTQLVFPAHAGVIRIGSE